MPAPEWLDTVPILEAIPANKLSHLTDRVARAQLYLQQAGNSANAISIDGRSGALRVHGFRAQSNRARYLAAFALDRRQGGITFERHGFMWNSVRTGCDPDLCGAARFLITRDPTLRLSGVEASGALLFDDELLSSVGGALEWLNGRNGGENPQLGGLALSAARVMIEDRQHTFRMPYFDKIYAELS